MSNVRPDPGTPQQHWRMIHPYRIGYRLMQ